MSRPAREYLDKHIQDADAFLDRLRQEQAAVQQRASELAAMIEKHQADRDEAAQARESLEPKVRGKRG